MTDFSEKAGSAKMALLAAGESGKSGASLLACTLAGSTLGAMSRQASGAAAKLRQPEHALCDPRKPISDAIKARRCRTSKRRWASTSISTRCPTTPCNRKLSPNFASGSSYYDIMIVDTP